MNTNKVKLNGLQEQLATPKITYKEEKPQNFTTNT